MKTKIEYITPVDPTTKKCRFFLTWTDDDGKIRAQAFYANPKDYGH